ncbi:MAG: 2OG-Fe(II) oxygenase family protein [Pseudomonadota bacterium]
MQFWPGFTVKRLAVALTVGKACNALSGCSAQTLWIERDQKYSPVEIGFEIRTVHMEIPLIDCDTAREDKAIASEIDQALSKIGFMALRNLGLTQSSVDAIFAVAQSFFNGPLVDKKRCAYGSADENFGYQGVGQESLDPTKPADLKETFTMRDLDGGHVADDRWPSELFRIAVRDFYQEIMGAAQRLQRLLALALGVDEGFFVDRHNGENITLRLLHYPPVGSSSIQRQQMGAGAHTDYGAITLLMTDGEPGLQVRARNGDWMDVPHVDGAYVVNIGDCLMRWTNDIYVSTPHRVLPPKRQRLSIAFFVEANPDTIIQALPGTGNAKYPPIRAADYLASRLEATYAPKEPAE